MMRIGYWKQLKIERKPFPNRRQIAVALGLNWGTVDKAIKYSKSLTEAHNRSKSVSKRIKHVAPPMLDQAAYEMWQKKGKKDPICEGQRERLMVQIKKEAKKLKKDISPTTQVFGELVLKHIKTVADLPLEGLIKLLDALKQKKAEILKDLQSDFAMFKNDLP